MWSKEKVLELIELLHSAPALWDTKSLEYKDRAKKFDELNKIAAYFQIDDDEVKKKIKSIKTQFLRERKKIIEREKNVADAIQTSATPDVEWFGYKLLTFLQCDQEKDEESSVSSIDIEHSSACLPGSRQLYVKKPLAITKTKATYQNESSALLGDILKRKMNDDRVDEVYKFVRRSVQENLQNKDDFCCYGENVANRMRNAQQSNRAVAIAKNSIDNILFKLEMGELEDVQQTPTTFECMASEIHSVTMCSSTE